MMSMLFSNLCWLFKLNIFTICPFPLSSSYFSSFFSHINNHLMKLRILINYESKMFCLFLLKLNIYCNWRLCSLKKRTGEWVKKKEREKDMRVLYAMFAETIVEKVLRIHFKCSIAGTLLLCCCCSFFSTFRSNHFLCKWMVNIKHSVQKNTIQLLRSTTKYSTKNKRNMKNTRKHDTT